MVDLVAGDLITDDVRRFLSAKETPLVYLIRFIAYALILIAIADKNWPRKRL